MIGRVGGARVERASAASRVRRKPARAGAVVEEGSVTPSSALRMGAAVDERDAGDEEPARRGRVAPAVLAALLKLRLGG